MEQSFSSSSGYLDPKIVSFVESKIHSEKILVVSKTFCPACTRAKQLLRGLAFSTGVNPTVFEIDKYALQYTKGIMKYISAQTGIRTVPQIYINGRFVGGNDVIQRLHREGRLVPLILNPMNASPSTTPANANGFGYMSYKTAPSLRVCAFKRNIQPVPTFQTQMPVKTTIPMIHDMKSEDFIGSHIGDSRRSSRSSVTSSSNWSTASSSFTDNQRYHPESIRSSITSSGNWSTVSSSLTGNQHNHRQRTPSSTSSCSIESWNKSFFNENQASLRSTDREILSKPAQEVSKPSFCSTITWRGAKSKLPKNYSPYMSDDSSYMTDEDILARPVFLSKVKQSSRKRFSRGRRLQEFSTIENERLPNSRGGFFTTCSANPVRKSRLVQKPINRGTSRWTYISSKVI